MLILGFDPGGVRKFGWCVAEVTPMGSLRVFKSGVEDHSNNAVSAALEIAGQREIAAAGIDSPLYWIASDKRRADVTIRAAMKTFGAKNRGGTVQSPNSLRGGCLVQGLMAARLLRKKDPALRITESHPKALLWLLKLAYPERPAAKVAMDHLSELITCDSKDLSEDERDAALGAVAAWAMINRSSGWRNLFKNEKEETFAPVSPIEYWMPIADDAV